MGKVVKFTGSRMLGDELRRLRGGRTFDDIVELGKTKLLAHGFKAIARGTLCDIENGKALPNIESVFALSVLYQIPASRFLHFLLEENLVSAVEPLATEEDVAAAYADALTQRRWPDALGIAIHGQKLAAPGWPALRWRLNRAMAIEKLGMRGDAIAELQECLESPDLPPNEKHRVHRELARMHGAARHLQLAEMHLAETQRFLPADAPPLTRGRLLESRAQMTLLRLQASTIRPVEEIAALESWIREARLCFRDASVGDLLLLDLYHARALLLRGDARHSRRVLRAVIQRARESALQQRLTEGHLDLGELEVSENALEAARKSFMRAQEVATEAGLMDLAFNALLQLAQVAESAEQREHFLRRCEKLYPLVDGTSPEAKAYERLKQRGVQ